MTGALQASGVVARLTDAVSLLDGEDLTTFARLESADKATLFTSSFASWELRIWDAMATDPSEPVYMLLGNAAASPPFYAALQTGTDWITDSIGYTFKHTITAQAHYRFRGGRRNRVEYRLALTGGAAFYIVRNVNCLITLS
jgi:L-alanine-DL-glutamate epimerase-like enolase superfamily enzyme